jgi:hypothetical protein
MEKLTIVNTILSRLSEMGVISQNGAGADITIKTEFLDAAWGSGNKKIEYNASAFFDESERTLYFWEFTKESGSGFSFGGESETSFQSGTTLFRKVKSVGFGIDGKAYEYSLDIGAITKTFKDTAKQHGWKFKVVLNREKASYPPGYVPLANNNQQQNADYQQPIIQQPQQQVYYSEPMSDTKKKGAGPLYWTLFSVTLLSTLLFYLLGGVSIIGCGIAAVVLITIFILGYKGIVKGALNSVIIFIVVLLLLFINLGIFAPEKKDITLNSDTSKTTVAKAGNTADALFVVSAIRSNISAHLDSKVINSESYYKPHADIVSFIDFQTIGKDMYSEKGIVAKISFINMKVTSSPKKGSVTYYVDFITPSADDTKFATKSSYEHTFTGSNIISSTSISLFMKVDNVKDYFKVTQPSVDSDQLLGIAGATWQDLKFTIEFDMKVEGKDGSTYLKHIVITMPQGDFINNADNNLNFDVKYDLKNDLANVMLIKQ